MLDAQTEGARSGMQPGDTQGVGGGATFSFTASAGVGSYPNF